MAGILVNFDTRSGGEGRAFGFPKKNPQSFI